MLPAWLPEWVIKHSTSPERVLRAASFAFNGHFEATPVLKKILGDRFRDFLLQKLSDSDLTAKKKKRRVFLPIPLIQQQREH
jgi:hypothetical protein